MGLLAQIQFQLERAFSCVIAWVVGFVNRTNACEQEKILLSKNMSESCDVIITIYCIKFQIHLDPLS